jgi:hypothetical protein
MEGISRASSQQTAPIASSTAVAEKPAVVTEDAKKESTTEVKSHSEAQKQNAVARQGENNLTAMLQRERMTEIPRTYIAKQDLNDLATALNSKSGAADGVKEELARTFLNNGPGQHAKIAECMRQFAATGSPSYNTAYKALRQEVSEWTRFDPIGITQPAQRSLFKEVASLRGPGSERVKADVALMINRNIDEAKNSPVHGLRAFAGMYTYELGKMLQSDPPGIFRVLEDSVKLRDHVPGMIDNLMNFREGHKAIGRLVGELSDYTIRSLMRSPQQSLPAVKNLDFFMKHVEMGIERNIKTREDMIEKGAGLVSNALKAVEALLPKGIKFPFIDKINDGIEWLKKRELENVQDYKKHLTSTMYTLVDSTFAAIADPEGNLAAGYADDMRLVKNYREALFIYDTLYWRNRLFSN